MLNWLTLSERQDSETVFVLVTVGEVKGSSPRETGTKMLVDEHRVQGTIGGGNLEFFAIEHARTLLRQNNQNQITQHTTPLTPQYDQCCGGVVQLLFETVNPKTSNWLRDLKKCLSESRQACLVTDLKQNRRFIQPLSESKGIEQSQWQRESSRLIEPVQKQTLPVFIFGTGHVGKAIIQQLQNLDVHITAIDNRADQLPAFEADNVTAILTDDWQTQVEQAPDNAYFLVLTHSHNLDFQIGEAILKRDRHHYFGLIGSRTKKVRFERQYKACGITETQLDNMTCPIGLPNIPGKSPATIAASVVAQILQIQANQNGQTNSQNNNTRNTKRIHHV